MASIKIDLLTLFPEMFRGPLDESLLKKAQENKLIEINLINLRDFTKDKHKTADDSPYGGGPGMVMKIEPIYDALFSLVALTPTPTTRIVMMCPAGEKLTQKKATELSQASHLIILCGHYEGVDERVRKNLVTDEISIGDYVLTGGEIPAMVLVDCVTRLIPGVVKENESLVRESFSAGLLDYPSYTRPEDFNGQKVPPVLLSGNHKEVARWRRKEMLSRTLLRRPELLAEADISEEDKAILKEILQET